MSAIFEGEELFAYVNRGTSPYLLITFSSAGHTDYASRWYLMNEAVQRNDINCIGITSNKRNFFLSPEIHEIAKLTERFRSAFSTIIMLGPSMGGYAAIKYSRLFGATHVLAFSPQYSMDPEELELSEDQKIYLRSGMIAHRIVRTEAHKTMAPRPDEVQGNVLIVYDTTEIVDTYAARMFERKFPEVRVNGFRSIGHFALDMYENDVSFLHLMNLIRLKDHDAVLQFLIKKLRENGKYLMNVINDAARRKPIMCARALESRNPRIVSNRAQIRATYIENIILINLYKRRKYAEAYNILQKRHFDELKDAGSVEKWSDEGGQPRYGQYLLFSELASFLAFDIVKNRPVFASSISAAPYLRPAIVEYDGEYLRITYSDSSQTHGFPLGDHPGVRCRAVAYGDVHSIELGSPEGVRRLRAYPDGKVELVSSDVGQHESFTLVAIPASFARAGLGGGSWFDQTLMRHVDNSGSLRLEMPRRSALSRLLRRVGPSDRRLQDPSG